jgi:hypothetical protein
MTAEERTMSDEELTFEALKKRIEQFLPAPVFSEAFVTPELDAKIREVAETVDVPFMGATLRIHVNKYLPKHIFVLQGREQMAICNIQTGEITVTDNPMRPEWGTLDRLPWSKNKR